MNDYINVIGAGLAGSEAAWQIANRGIKVRLYEMKPKKFSPAHHMESFAELVCSNSLRSDQLENAVGLLKEEMRILGSLIISCADDTRVPAGGALAVDRSGFSEEVTRRIKNHKNITIINDEVTELPDEGITVVASGPLTSEGLSETIGKLIGEKYLHFFDAAAPIVTLETIDMSKAFKAARYGRGTDDYINCPMNKEEYFRFYDALINSEKAEIKDFEKKMVFEGCLPIESMAERGIDTMRFGPLKPVGLIDPNTGKEAYAVVQLRQDNKEGTLYNIVGFQTHLKFADQKRVFSLIPGLEAAEFVRYGVMHRNTFINSPKLLDATFNYISKNNLFFAGQMSGVEGYVESAASGLNAGINASHMFLQKDKVIFPTSTAIGALSHYISDGSVKNFQPMNVNFGIVDTLNQRIRDKRQKNSEISKRAIQAVLEVKATI